MSIKQKLTKNYPEFISIKDALTSLAEHEDIEVEAVARFMVEWDIALTDPVVRNEVLQQSQGDRKEMIIAPSLLKSFGD